MSCGIMFLNSYSESSAVSPLSTVGPLDQFTSALVFLHSYGALEHSQTHRTTGSSGLLSPRRGSPCRRRKFIQQRYRPRIIIRTQPQPILSTRHLLNYCQCHFGRFGMGHCSSEECNDQSPFSLGSNDGRIFFENTCDSSHELFRNCVEDARR